MDLSSPLPPGNFALSQDRNDLRKLFDSYVSFFVKYNLYKIRCDYPGRDAEDDKFLELAVNGSADLIVTGDADLLALNPFREIEIITPSFFINRFQEHTD